mgnify:CR=1 FL=1
MIIVFRDNAVGRELVVDQLATVSAWDSVTVYRSAMGQPVDTVQRCLGPFVTGTHVFFQFWRCFGILYLAFGVGGNCTGGKMELRTIVLKTWYEGSLGSMVILEDSRCFVSVDVQLGNKGELIVSCIFILVSFDIGECWLEIWSCNVQAMKQFAQHVPICNQCGVW